MFDTFREVAGMRNNNNRKIKKGICKNRFPFSVATTSDVRTKVGRIQFFRGK